MLNLNSEKFLSKKQINDVASSVFTNRPSSEVTDNTHSFLQKSY